MSSSTLEHCPHERRPGTTVCLHCRHEEREIARARRRQLMGKLGVGVLGLAVLAVAGVAAAAALQGRQTRTAATQPVPEQRASEAESRAEPRQAGTPVATPVSNTAATAPAPVPNAATPPLTPIIAEGRTDFANGVFAMRAGGNVEVHFDTPEARTRRADKFERMVRTTLPLVYGPMADSLLAKIPDGMVDPKELLTELPVRGVQLSLGGGWTLALHPETRPGQEGPLVVRYRAYTVKE